MPRLASVVSVLIMLGACGGDDGATGGTEGSNVTEGSASTAADPYDSRGPLPSTTTGADTTGDDPTETSDRTETTDETGADTTGETGAEPSAFWKGLSPGWTPIFEGDNAAVTAENEPPGGIAAYSGMAVDSTGGRLFVFGGGHNDYYGNEVWVFDLEALTWERSYAPDIGPNPPVESIWPRVDATTLPGGYTDTVRPYSRHTYSSVHWIVSLDRMIAGGGSSYSGNQEYLWDGHGGPHLNAPKDTWQFDPVTTTWEFMGSTLLDPGYLSASYSTYDAAADRVFALGKSASGTWTIVEYDPGANTWTDHAVAATASAGSVNMASDSQRERVLIFGGDFPTNDELWAYHVPTQAWTDLSPAGLRPPAGGGYGLTVDSTHDRYLATKDGTMWIFDPTTETWITGASGPPNVAQVMGRLKFDRLRGVSLLANRNGASFAMDIWAYKFEGA